MAYIKRTILALSVTSLLSACGDGSLSAQQSALTLGITDAPIDDALEVWVEFTGIEVKPLHESAISIDFNQAKRINLLALQGSEFSYLLNEKSLQRGEYSWLRLKVNALQNTSDSTLVTSNGTYSLYVPSGSENGLLLNQGFTIPTNDTLELTIDFDLRKSITGPVSQSSSNYYLRPTLRLVQTDTTGHISGTINTNTLQDANCTGTDYAVYAYEGSNITPDDVGGTGVDPLTTALVETNQYSYTIGYLTQGYYTVAFTCEANLDGVESEETLKFIGTSNVYVTAGSTTTHNF